MNRGFAKNFLKLTWLTNISVILILITIIRSATAIAPSGSTHQFMQCQSSLRHFSAHLEARKGDNKQAYYDDLYKQIQYFLKSLDDLPISSSQLIKCENLLKALQDIVGNHTTRPELEPMPTASNANHGKLTMPGLEKQRRPLKQVHIRYVCEEPKKTEDKLKDNVELDELTSYTNPALSRLRKSSSTGEPKDIEK